MLSHKLKVYVKSLLLKKKKQQFADRCNLIQDIINDRDNKLTRNYLSKVLIEMSKKLDLKDINPLYSFKCSDKSERKFAEAGNICFRLLQTFLNVELLHFIIKCFTIDVQ